MKTKAVKITLNGNDKGVFLRLTDSLRMIDKVNLKFGLEIEDTFELLFLKCLRAEEGNERFRYKKETYLSVGYIFKILNYETIKDIERVKSYINNQIIVLDSFHLGTNL